MMTAANHLGERLAPLLQAHEYARDVQEDPWQFAVEREALHTAGVEDNDLRWMMQKGHLSHARETTAPGQTRRSFEREPVFGPRSCFVLTDQGACYVAILVARARGDLAALRPHWDSERRELSLVHLVIKRFGEPAPNQELLLAAFEEQGWAEHIDDPLPGKPDIVPRQRLYDTVKRLNRSMHGCPLRFHVEHGGQGVRWELEL